MNEKELKIPFNALLHELDTETQTYGCRQNNPAICENNGLSGICAFASKDGICQKNISSLEKAVPEAQKLSL